MIFLRNYLQAIAQRCSVKKVFLETLNLITLLALSFTNICGLRSKLLMANLFLNQTLLAYLLYVRQTWMTQFILAISL